MDLAELQDLETIEVQIKKADGKPVTGSDDQPWTIKLAGPSHPVTFRSQDVVTLTVRRVTEQKEKGGEPESDEDVKLRVLAGMIDRTLGWTPVIFNGKPFPFSRENAIALYSTSALVRTQVEEALYNDGNFRKRPSKPS